jgi:hypothetical protein
MKRECRDCPIQLECKKLMDAGSEHNWRIERLESEARITQAGHEELKQTLLRELEMNSRRLVRTKEQIEFWERIGAMVGELRDQEFVDRINEIVNEDEGNIADFRSNADWALDELAKIGKPPDFELPERSPVEDIRRLSALVLRTCSNGVSTKRKYWLFGEVEMSCGSDFAEEAKEILDNYPTAEALTAFVENSRLAGSQGPDLLA